MRQLISFFQADVQISQIFSDFVPFQVEEMEEKLIKLRGGVILVSPEERKAVECMYSDTMHQWRRRKRMFRDLWDAITENSPKDLKEFKVTYNYLCFVLNLQILFV